MSSIPRHTAYLRRSFSASLLEISQSARWLRRKTCCFAHSGLSPKQILKFELPLFNVQPREGSIFHGTQTRCHHCVFGSVLLVHIAHMCSPSLRLPTWTSKNWKFGHDSALFVSQPQRLVSGPNFGACDLRWFGRGARASVGAWRCRWGPSRDRCSTATRSTALFWCRDDVVHLVFLGTWVQMKVPLQITPIPRRELRHLIGRQETCLDLTPKCPPNSIGGHPNLLLGFRNTEYVACRVTL